MKRESTIRLKWFMDFIYADIREMDYPELCKLNMEIEAYIRDGLYDSHRSVDDIIFEVSTIEEGIEKESYFLNVSKRRLIEIEKMQTTIRSAFEEITEGIKTVQDDNYPLPPLQGLVTNPVKIAKSSVSIKPKLFMPYIRKKDESKTNWFSKPFRLEIESDNESNMLLLLFFKELAGVPINSLIKCEECDKWFFHISNRERKFCTNKCAARSGNRTRRQRLKKEDPKRYKKELEENKKRAIKSYERKVRSKTPNAYIRHRAGASSDTDKSMPVKDLEPEPGRE